jgi:Ni/Co efflux regulator RcnB
MKTLNRALITSAVVLTLSAGTVIAQDHHDDRDRDHRDNGHQQYEHHQRYVHHEEWRRGEHIRHEDWNRGEQIDYRHYHLRRPPRGYEWREVDGNYILAAVATGVIASVIAASVAH